MEKSSKPSGLEMFMPMARLNTAMETFMKGKFTNRRSMGWGNTFIRTEMSSGDTGSLTKNRERVNFGLVKA